MNEIITDLVEYEYTKTLQVFFSDVSSAYFSLGMHLNSDVLKKGIPIL